jgi:Na+-driven multidrug efflux pump
MSLTILSMWILRLPLAYFLSHYIFNSVTGVWVAFPVSNVITAIAGIILFLKGSWKTKKIIGD